MTDISRSEIQPIATTPTSIKPPQKPDVRPPNTSELSTDCREPRFNKEPRLGNQPQDALSSSPSVIQGDGEDSEETIIESMGIRATDLSLGLRRVPMAFYIVVQHSGFEWKTKNKRVTVSNDAVEWDDSIPMPSDLSATIDFEVFATFELQPTLGCGEQLRKITTSVGQILDHSASSWSFTFPKDGHILFPCSSLLVTTNKRNRISGGSWGTRVIGPDSPTTDELEVATDQGHCALLRYQKHGVKENLKRSIEEFQRALDICPPNHPCRAAAQSNMAMANFILPQVDYSDNSLDVSLSMYQSALSSRPVGHPDRPITLIHFATAHLARFDDNVDVSLVESLLDEAKNLGGTGSHEDRVATFILLRLRARRRSDGIQFSQPMTDPDSTPGFQTEDPLTLSVRLFYHFRQFGTLHVLERAISTLEAFILSAPTGEGDYLSGLTNLGLAYGERFEYLGHLGDLDQAISRYRNVADLAPDGHPEKPFHLNRLGNFSFRRFRCLGKLCDLEQAIPRLRDAVDLTPDGHSEKPNYLRDLGISLKTRFERLEEPCDLEHAISSFRNAVDLIPDNDSDKPSHLSYLGLSLKARFGHLGKLQDLEQAISTLTEVVNISPDDDPDKPGHLNNLAISLKARFERLGRLDDLDQAISRLGNAVDLTPDGHPKKPVCLANLGSSSEIRFQRLGKTRDMKQAISSLRDAVHLTPDGHPDKLRYLDCLCLCLTSSFEHLGELGDLEQAISWSKQAVDLTPDGHRHKSRRLNTLGISLGMRFQYLGDHHDLEEAISRFRHAIDLTPDDHPNKPHDLSNLGAALLTRFEHIGELPDLEQAISSLRNAVDLTPDGRPSKVPFLSNLGVSFLTRYERVGDVRDLEHGILVLTNVVDLTPDDHPEKSKHLTNLGNSFSTRFERLGELGDLEQAISKHNDAVNLISDGHPSKPACLSNLGGSLAIHFERLGKLDDLEEAISKLKCAVDLTHDGHPNRPSYLSELGKCFTVRFEHLGELRDLEQAISKLEYAVDIIPDDGHPHMLACLNNLADSYLARFNRLGVLSDLERAISSSKAAADLMLDGHPDKPIRIGGLSDLLCERFRHLGELRDLEQAISRLTDSVEFIPDDHPSKFVLLGSLGSSFFTRFRHIGGLHDLEQAVSRLTDAVNLTPDGHLSKPINLNNLGLSLKARFERLKEPSDLEKAISWFGEAVDLIPNGHPKKPVCLSNLSNTFRVRFEQLGALGDLEQAISRSRDAVDLTPEGHPDKPGHLNNLGLSFRTRFKHLREPGDLEQAISVYSKSASAFVAPTTSRLYASKNWITCARNSQHHSLLDAYSAAINLLPQIAWIGVPLTDRYRQLLQVADMAREAAATALDSELPQIAVELLEQGRSVIWGDLFLLRDPYEGLAAVHPDHAEKLRQLAFALEQASSVREKSLSLLQEGDNKFTKSLEDVADRHRGLALERDELLQRIRELPGFERFLLCKQFSQLHASAHSGPVVILNAAEKRCDALIILANRDDMLHVPLSNFDFKRSDRLQTLLKNLVPREGRPLRSNRFRRWKAILSALWKNVVKPVLDALGFSIRSAGQQSRLFWCPTGPFTFLPIHAAGLYDEQHLQPGHKLSDYVVSSYVPTLSSLAPRLEPEVPPSGDLRILAIRQPLSDGLSPLPGVTEEIRCIDAIIQSTPESKATLITSTVGTVEEVLGLMQEADWVHFACHGIQDDDEPTNSGICLADERRLKLSDMMSLSRSRGGLAFLSACQTAKGDKALSEEAIHIAAGMLFAGYGSVIATMWSISDRIAPCVAGDVYAQLFQDGSRPDPRQAARALQNAVGRIRDSGAPFEDWLPFIHVGL